MITPREKHSDISNDISKLHEEMNAFVDKPPANMIDKETMLYKELKAWYVLNHDEEFYKNNRIMIKIGNLRYLICPGRGCGYCMNCCFALEYDDYTYVDNV
jgi:hypothetical protein